MLHAIEKRELADVRGRRLLLASACRGGVRLLPAVCGRGISREPEPRLPTLPLHMQVLLEQVDRVVLREEEVGKKHWLHWKRGQQDA